MGKIFQIHISPVFQGRCFVFYLLFLSSIFASCNRGIDEKYITSRVWVYDSGFNPDGGDFISFEDGSFSLRGDTLFLSGSPKGIIKSLKKSKNEIIVLSLDRSKEAKYIDTREFIE